MTKTTIGLSPEIHAYVTDHSAQPDSVLEDLAAETDGLGPISRMQIAQDQGALFSVLVGAMQPAFAVEIGTFTGYSAITIARALPDGGRLLCCDVSEEWTSIARRYWDRAGVLDRIDLVLAPAIDTLAALDPAQTVDFAFIDADKTGYIDYYEALVPRMSTGSILAVDNTLWSGAVIDSSDTSEDTEALRRFNRFVADDPRTTQVLTPIGDGLTLIRLA